VTRLAPKLNRPGMLAFNVSLMTEAQMGLLDNLSTDDIGKAAEVLAPLAKHLAPPYGPVLAALLPLAGDVVDFIAEDKRTAVLEQIRAQLRAGVFNEIQAEIDAKFPNG